MAKSPGNLESGLTRFLNTLYACFRFMSRFLVCCQFCECPTHQRKCKKKVDGEQSINSQTTNSKKSRISATEFSFPKRYILAIMTFLGFMNMYALRVNLNVAIGAMVNNHTVHQKGYTITRVKYLLNMNCVLFFLDLHHKEEIQRRTIYFYIFLT